MALVHAGNPASLLPGTEVGPWRVVSRLGGGAYGVVYLVEKIGQEDAGLFALKMARHSRDPRFEREGELLSRIHHPHVPRLHDRGWWVAPAGVAFPYVVMDWIEGVPLYAWASEHPRSWREMMRVLAQVAWALAATHAVEGVHRDVKGENVLVRKVDGAAVLIDFGSANYRGASTITRQLPPPGTPQYQSPESLRFEWEHLRERSARYEAQPTDDIYALGMMAYRLATGRYPPPVVEVEETEEGNRFILLSLVPPEKWVELSPEFAALIRQMLSAEPSARGSAAEVALALERAAKAAGPEDARALPPERVPAPASRPAPAPAPRRLQASRWRHVLGSAVGLAVLGACLAIGGWWTKLLLFREECADTETSGLGDDASSATMCGGEPAPAPRRISAEVPQKPLPGQRRSPCVNMKPMVEINGGCWIGPTEEAPPCGTDSYEWRSRCYWPVWEPSRPGTAKPQQR